MSESAAGIGLRDPTWARAFLIGLTVLFLGALLVAPLVLILTQALARGFGAYVAAVTDPYAMSAIRLTLIAAAISVPVNVAFGVVAALIFVLVFGLQGWLGPFLIDRGIRIIFAVPGIVLATLFITFPFVARELIHIMETQGTEEEEAARLMGASWWRIVTRVTLPNARWALFYGIVLCNARAMGEFGAVSVVSGHIRGRTNTLPLHVEILYNEYSFAAAYAAASVLALLAVVTLVLKVMAEQRLERAAQAAADESLRR